MLCLLVGGLIRVVCYPFIGKVFVGKLIVGLFVLSVLFFVGWVRFYFLLVIRCVFVGPSFV